MAKARGPWRMPKPGVMEGSESSLAFLLAGNLIKCWVVIFFFYELVWVQIGPNPDLFPPEASRRLEGIRILAVLMQLASQGAHFSWWVQGLGSGHMRRSGIADRDSHAMDLMAELTSSWATFPSSWFPPCSGKVLLQCRKCSGETCSRIWGKTLETELFQAVADNQFLQAEHVTMVMGVMGVSQ